MKPLLLALITGSLGFAQSFTGALNATDANSVFLVRFSLAAPATVKVQSWGYGGSAAAPGGTNAAGAPIAPGGFDPYFTLFSGAGLNATFLTSNDDGACPPGTRVATFCFDPSLSVNLPAGSYTLAVSTFENISFAENLGTGTISDLFINLGNYYDPYSATLRTSNYAFDISGSVNVISTGPAAGPPVISKAFSNAVIPVNASTSLTLTLANPGLVGMTGVAFTDPLPAGLVIDSPSVTAACGGTLTTTTTSITLAGGTLVGLANCVISVPVRGATQGAKVNVTSKITSTEAGTGNSAIATVTVAVPLQISKAFGAAIFPVNTITPLTIVITNPNPVPITDAGVVDALPGNLKVATPSGLSNTCGGTVTATAGSGSVTLLNGTVPTNGACSITVNVLGTTQGAANNTTGPITSTMAGNGPTATANTYVALPLSITKAFGQAVLPLNGVTTLTLTLRNPNAVAITDVILTDNLPVGLLVASPNGLVNTCAGAATANAGTTVVSLVIGAVPANGACTITVNITGTTPGTLINTTNPISSVQSGTGNAATASIIIGGEFLIRYAANLTSGDSVINLTNTGANGAALNGPGFGGAAGNLCMNVYAFSAFAPVPVQYPKGRPTPPRRSASATKSPCGGSQIAVRQSPHRTCRLRRPQRSYNA